MTTTESSTRTRILDAAWSLTRERGINVVTIGQIAGAAGVSRQLVYFHFENRAGLLLAMTRQHDARGFIERVAEAREMPPVAGLEQLLKVWCDYIPDILPVARALFAASITGEDGAAAWHDRMSDLREAFRIAVDRVAEDGRLAGGWTAESATDWIWARAQVTVYQHLVVERGWGHDEYVEAALNSILGEIVKPPSKRRRSR